MQKMPKPVLLVDTRERTPWDFEGDDEFSEIKHVKLDGGDYAIEGMQHLVVIERKANADELFNNFTQNKERIFAEFERLKNHKMRVIVIEESCDDVFNPNNYYVNKKGLNKRDYKMPVAVVASNLTELMVNHNVHVIFGGHKARAIARGILLQAYKLHRQGKL